MTILEVIQRSTDFLAKKGVSSPRLQVEHLLAHVLQMPRMKLYLNFERIPTPEQLETVRQLVRRRGQREPLQYITGTAPFCAFELEVNSHVLVPRPETELLAELGWKFLKESGVANGAGVTALDLGTGSGCLAIALALNAPQASVFASDASSAALALARKNAARNNAAIQFCEGDLFDALPASSRYHLIVSNPPYIPTARIASLEPEVRDHEPVQALDGGADGLDFYHRIAARAAAFLEPAGCVMLELDEEGAEAAAEIFRRGHWLVDPILSDLTHRPRILIARPGRTA